ncbi:MAG: PAS domain-containing protein [bacterium]
MDLTVRPILEQSAMRGLMMVMFRETAAPTKGVKDKPRRMAVTRRSHTVEEIEQELRHTKENLQTTIEELETSNEELKSTNEELQSTNEELQSTNEEMETSKEELQSLNEESATVNAELQSRIDELSKANDDMKNLLDSTEIATLFLDNDLCVRRFTPKATKIIPLSGTDSGRPVQHFASNLIDINLAEYAKMVLDDLTVREIEVWSKDRRRFLMRVRPYRTVSNVIAGVVITFEDITELKQAVDELHIERGRLRAALEAIPAMVYLVSKDYSIRFANQNFRDLFGGPYKRKCYEILQGCKDPCNECPTLRVFETGKSEKWEWTSPAGQPYIMHAVPFSDIDGSPLVLEVGIGIDELQRSDRAPRRDTKGKRGKE